MIKAIANADDKKIIVLGLSRENMRRLLEGQPIEIDWAEVGVDDQPNIVILGGETESDIIGVLAQVRRADERDEDCRSSQHHRHDTPTRRVALMSSPQTVDELRAKITDKGPWFDVPAGTPEADCERCDADALYWTLTKNGKRMLVDCGVKGGQKPLDPATRRLVDESDGINEKGRGVSHFATCPHAAHFSHRSKS